MIKLDANYLDGLGLGSLPREEANVLLGHIYDTLQLRVGTALANRMTETQLDEFEVFYQAQDDAGALGWLETNFPSYREIVHDEFNALTDEVQHSAPTILALTEDMS